MMKETAVVFRYALSNVLRTKWLPLYGLFFLAFASAILRFTGDGPKAVAGLMNVVLLTVPMAAVLYGAISWYNSSAFVHLLLTQPVRRASVFLASWLAVSVGLAAGFLIGAGLPLLAGARGPGTFLLLIVGVSLTFIFAALGMLIAILNPDRMRGIGLALTAWLYTALLHDAVVFFVLSALKEYPIEVPGMILMAVNPIDLARVSLLLSLDLSAMMGYTGKVLQRTISSPAGLALTIGVLQLWVVVPVLLAVRRFKKADL